MLVLRNGEGRHNRGAETRISLISCQPSGAPGWHSAGTAIVAANSRLTWTLLQHVGSAGWKCSLLNLKVLGSLFKEIFSHWTDDKAPRLGAALAYLLHHIFPGISPIIAIAVTGLAFGAQAAQGSVVEQIPRLGR